MTFALPWLLALVQSAGSPPPPPPPSQAAPPSAPQTTAPADPARLVFAPGTSGLVLVLVKADRTADYEAVLLALRTSLQSADAAERALAAGWQIFKAQEKDAKGNVVYVHWIPSPVADADYRPSVVLDRLSATLPEPLLVKYRDAIVGAPARLSLDALGALGALGVVPAPRR